MPLSIRHSFTSSKPNGTDTSLVRPSDWNAEHDITGTVEETLLSFSDVTTADASAECHGLLMKLPDDASLFLDGEGNWSTPVATATDVTETSLSLTDVTTANATSGRHGFLKKLPNDASLFMDGSGNWSALSIPETLLSLTDVTTGNASTGRHGFLKKLPNNANLFMDGVGNWSTPAGGSESFWTSTEGGINFLDGNVGIGDTPSCNLVVSGEAVQGVYGKINVYITSNSSETGIQLTNLSDTGRSYTILSTGEDSTAGAGKFIIGVDQGAVITVSNSLVGVGTVDPEYDLDVNGDINFTGDLRRDGEIVSFSGLDTTEDITWTGAHIFTNSVGPSDATGIYINPMSTAPMGNLTGLRIAIGNASGEGEILDTVYNIYIAAPQPTMPDGGDFANVYGLYIEDQSAASPTESHSNITSLGVNSTNFFEGTIRTVRLQVGDNPGCDNALMTVYQNMDGNANTSMIDIVPSAIEGFSGDGAPNITGVVLQPTAQTSLDSLTGLYVQSRIFSGETQNSYSIRVAAPSYGEAGCENQHGLYIDEQTSSGDSYNIYSAGTESHNHFEGSVHVGGKLSTQTSSKEMVILGNASEVTVDCSLADIFHYATSASGYLTTWTFINVSPGQHITLIVLNNSGDYEMVWPENVVGGGQINPALHSYTVMEFHTGVSGNVLIYNDPGRKIPGFAICDSAANGLDNDSVSVQAGIAQVSSAAHGVSGGNLRLSVFNIEGVNNANPVTITLPTTEGIVDGQLLSIIEIEGSIGSAVNGLRTVTVLDGSTISVDVNGTGLEYEGGGRVGIGYDTDEVDVTIVANINSGQLVFMLDNFQHGCILNSTSEIASPVDKNLGGSGVCVGKLTFDPETALFTDKTSYAEAAHFIPVFAAGANIDLSYTNEELVIDAVGLPTSVVSGNTTMSADEQFVLFGDTDVLVVTLEGSGGTIHSSMAVGRRLVLVLKQDGDGNRAIDFGAEFKGFSPPAMDADSCTVYEMFVLDSANVILLSATAGMTLSPVGPQ